MGRFLALDEVSFGTIRTVHGYWERIRHGRRFPAKSDVDPAEIKAALPYIMISEIHRDPLRVRYRLVGTEVVHFTGEDFTGKWLHETGWGEYIDAVEQKYVRMFETGGPIFGVDFFTQRTDGKRKPYEWAIFPLAEDGEHVDYCLLVEDYRPLDRLEAPQR
jgi:hypothetical protein